MFVFIDAYRMIKKGAKYFSFVFKCEKGREIEFCFESFEVDGLVYAKNLYGLIFPFVLENDLSPASLKQQIGSMLEEFNIDVLLMRGLLSPSELLENEYSDIFFTNSFFVLDLDQVDTCNEVMTLLDGKARNLIRKADSLGVYHKSFTGISEPQKFHYEYAKAMKGLNANEETFFNKEFFLSLADSQNLVELKSFAKNGEELGSSLFYKFFGAWFYYLSYRTSFALENKVPVHQAAIFNFAKSYCLGENTKIFLGGGSSGGGLELFKKKMSNLNLCHYVLTSVRNHDKVIDWHEKRGLRFFHNYPLRSLEGPSKRD